VSGKKKETEQYRPQYRPRRFCRFQNDLRARKEAGHPPGGAAPSRGEQQHGAGIKKKGLANKREDDRDVRTKY
jgi:hypothetical protein